MNIFEWWVVLSLVYIKICVIINWIIGIKNNNELSKRVDILERKIYRMKNGRVFGNSV